MVGLSFFEFEKITPRTFNNILKAYQRKEEAAERERWEMHREVCISIIRPHLKKADSKKTLQQLYPLPWDKKTAVKSSKAKTNPVEYWAEIDKRTKKKST